MNCYNVKFIFVVGILLPSISANAQTPQNAPANLLQWKASMYGTSADDSLSSARIVGVKGEVKANHIFSPTLHAKFRGGAQLETGSSSSLFTNEYEPSSRLFLQEATLFWHIFTPLSVEAGAIDQSHHQSPLLIDGGSFPAAMLAVDLHPHEWLIHADSQAAIPTGKNLTTKSTGKEPTPLLYTQKIIGGWDNSENSFLLRGSHFTFQNLTHGIAQDSRFYGNSVEGIGSAARFLYQYEGFEGGADYKLHLGSKFSWQGGASFIQNQKAPSSKNQGSYLYTQVVFSQENWQLTPKAEYYRNEADASPAFYSSSEFGHNNRKGYGAGLNLALPKTKIEFNLTYRSGKLIEPKTFQKNRFDFFQLSIGIPYESL